MFDPEINRRPVVGPEGEFALDIDVRYHVAAEGTIPVSDSAVNGGNIRAAHKTGRGQYDKRE